MKTLLARVAYSLDSSINFISDRLDNKFFRGTHAHFNTINYFYEMVIIPLFTMNKSEMKVFGIPTFYSVRKTQLTKFGSKLF